MINIRTIYICQFSSSSFSSVFSRKASDDGLDAGACPSFLYAQTILTSFADFVYHCHFLPQLHSYVLILSSFSPAFPVIRQSQLISSDSILRSCSFFTVQQSDPYNHTERTVD